MKLRNILILLLLAAVALPATAQQWELDFGDLNDINQYSWINAGVIDAKGNAIMVGRYGRIYNWQTQLIKVHPDGSYERRVCEDLPRMLMICDLVQLDNGNYFTVGSVSLDSVDCIRGGRELWAIVFDSNLDTVMTKVYTQDALDMICWPKLLLDDDGNVVAIGHYYELIQKSYYRSHPYMYRFDENCDILTCRYVKPEQSFDDPEFRFNHFKCFNILKNPAGDGYVLLCPSRYEYIGTVFYDRNFQYEKQYAYTLNIGTSNVNGFALAGYSDYFLSDDRLLFFGTQYQYNGLEHEELCLTIGDLDLNESVGPTSGDYGKINHYELGIMDEVGRNESVVNGGKSMATVNDTTMYGYYNTNYCSYCPSQPGVCLFDSDMEILGGRFFDDERYQYYSPNIVLPYSDGGCLLVMNDGDGFSEYSASKVLKMTREDMHPIPTSVKEMPHEAVKALAYPNPAREELHIDISCLPEGGDCRVNITDALGRVRLDRYIRGEGNVLTVGVGCLPAGVYGYRIYNADGEIVGGKFVKE